MEMFVVRVCVYNNITGAAVPLGGGRPPTGHQHINNQLPNLRNIHHTDSAPLSQARQGGETEAARRVTALGGSVATRQELETKVHPKVRNTEKALLMNDAMFLMLHLASQSEHRGNMTHHCP